MLVWHREAGEVLCWCDTGKQERYCVDVAQGSRRGAVLVRHREAGEVLCWCGTLRQVLC